MIESMFSTLLKMSLTSSIVATIIILFRSLFINKFPKTLIYGIWAILLIRLLIPFSIETSFSFFNLIPDSTTDIKNTLNLNEMTLTEYKSDLNNTNLITQNISSHIFSNSSSVINPNEPNNPVPSILLVASYIWLIGLIGLLIYSIYLYFKIRNKLKFSIVYQNTELINKCCSTLKIKRKINVYTSEYANTPFVYGLIKPRIIIPKILTKCFNDEQLKHIIIHELIHIKRYDYIIKPLILLALYIHWFNPLMWICAKLAEKDMEMSCDEKVLSISNKDIKSEYAMSLIHFLEKQNSFIKCGIIGFGESNIKSRVKGIIKYKKRNIFIVILAVIIIIILMLLLLTDKKIKKENASLLNNNLSAKNIESESSLIVDYSAEKLLDFRTKYIGDASNVSNLLNILPLAKYKEGISLQTTNEPYGITINYNLKNSNDTENNIESLLQDNALIMFSLIENLNNVTYNIEDIDGQNNLHFTKNEFQKYFDEELWEYSKDYNTFKEFILNNTFKIIISPDKYTPAMSSSPGISINVNSYKTDCVINYKANNGMFYLWDEASGVVSVGGKIIELPYGTFLFWVPFDEKEAFVNNDIINITVFDKSNNTINEKQIKVTKDDEGFYTVVPDYNILFSDNYANNNINNETKTQNPTNIDDAVAAAILAQGNNYGRGECLTEGHIILGSEEKDNKVKVYTLSSIGWFGFENGIFTNISGSGAVPTVMTFSINSNGAYILEDYKEPMGGAYYTKSIKEMFPEKLLDKVLSAHDSYELLKKQQELQASKYLQQIGKENVIIANNVEKELIDINVDASNKLFTEYTKYNSFLNNCPYWIGTVEKVEGGIRYIYETSQDLSDDGYDLVIFKKMNDNGAIIEKYVYKIIESDPVLIEYISPTLNKEIKVPIDMEEIKELQNSVDNGHRVGLLDPVQVAYEFSQDKLNINNFKKAEQIDTDNDITTILLYLNDGRIIEVKLIQPIRKDKTGIWTVTNYKTIFK